MILDYIYNLSIFKTFICIREERGGLGFLRSMVYDCLIKRVLYSYKILFFQTCPKKSYKLRINPIFSYILSLLSKTHSRRNIKKNK